MSEQDDREASNEEQRQESFASEGRCRTHGMTVCEECAYDRGFLDGLRKGESGRDDVLGLLRNTRMEHGLCYPRERRACTHCNSREQLEKIVIAWKGHKVYAT